MKEVIQQVFNVHEGRYGYRRIITVICNRKAESFQNQC
jgi:hypothetical protein